MATKISLWFIETLSKKKKLDNFFPILKFCKHFFCEYLHGQVRIQKFRRPWTLSVQWLRVSTSKARGVGSVPGGGTRILHTMWLSEKILKIKTEQKFRENDIRFQFRVVNLVFTNISTKKKKIQMRRKKSDSLHGSVLNITNISYSQALF